MQQSKVTVKGTSLVRHKMIDISDILSAHRGGGDNSFTDRTVGKILEYYLVGEMDEASEYVDWFNEIRHANSNDVVKIYINSPGGDLFTMIQFLRVLRESKAHIIGSVEGACMSAATVILLACDSYEISDHSNFMVHNYSGGAFGKGGEMKDQLAFESKWAEGFLHDVYKDFLTESEITSMLDGKDIWMSSGEVIDRLNARKTIKESIKTDSQS